MYKLLTTVAAVAVLLCGLQSAQAQIEGYRFGTGLSYAGVDGFNPQCGRNLWGLPIAPTPRIDAPPFFALYPPVYYSKDIVARPYGVSPFAAPSGIVPVEMGAPVPLYQSNPYFSQPVAPSESVPIVPNSTEGTSTEGQKTTWIRNPHFDPLATTGSVIASN